MKQLDLVGAGFKAIFDLGFLQISLRYPAYIQLLTQPGRWASFWGWACVWKMQSGIVTQVGNQVQVSVAHHVEGRMIAKVAVQHQVGQMDRALDGGEETLQHLLDAL